jgi:hypothetical protein
MATPFHQEFARRVGEALRDRHEAPSVDPVALYQEWVLDDPLWQTVEPAAVLALQKALVETPGDLRLSNRLVDGVGQIAEVALSARSIGMKANTIQQSKASMTGKSQQQQKTDKNATLDDKDDTSVESESIEMSFDEGEAKQNDRTQDSNGKNNELQSAIAGLMWTIHGRIPLLCLRASSSLRARQDHLGSYRGSAANSVPSAPIIEATQSMINDIESTDDGNKNAADDLEDVWAAESDPSDFDFGESCNTTPFAIDASLWDAIELSKPTNESSAAAVMGLLRPTVAYKYILLYMPYAQAIVDTWTETSLILVQLASGDTSHYMAQDAQVLYQDWQVCLQEIWTAWKDQIQTSTEYKAYLDGFLSLHRALLHEESTKSKNVRMWALREISSLCQDELSNMSRSAVLTDLHRYCTQVCDDWAMILESIDNTYMLYDTLAVSASLLHVWSRGLLHNVSSAQTLLNSGVWRLWLKETLECHERATNDSADDDKSTARPSEHASYYQMWAGAILECTMGAPALLGKYAWRYPKWAYGVTQLPSADTAHPNHQTVMINNLMSVLLWSLVGIQVSDPRPTVVWKKATQGPPTHDQCIQKSYTCLSTLCQVSTVCVSQWVELLQCKSIQPFTVDQLRWINDWIQLSKALQHAWIREILNRELTKEHDYVHLILNCIRDCESKLSQWKYTRKSKKQTDKHDNANNSVGEDDDRDTAVMEEQETRAQTTDQSDFVLHAINKGVQVLRKEFKAIKSLLDSRLSSTTMSSKAD